MAGTERVGSSASSGSSSPTKLTPGSTPTASGQRSPRGGEGDTHRPLQSDTLHRGLDSEELRARLNNLPPRQDENIHEPSPESEPSRVPPESGSPPEHVVRLPDGVLKFFDLFTNPSAGRHIRDLRSNSTGFVGSVKGLYHGENNLKDVQEAAKTLIKSKAIKWGLIAGGLSTVGVVLVAVICAAATYPILKSAIANGTAAGNRRSFGAPPAPPLAYSLPPSYGSPPPYGNYYSQYG